MGVWVVGVVRVSGSGLRAAMIGNWVGGAEKMLGQVLDFFGGGLGDLRSWQVLGLFGFENLAGFRIC